MPSELWYRPSEVRRRAVRDERRRARGAEHLPECSRRRPRHAIPIPDVKDAESAEPEPREEDAEGDHPDPRVPHRDRRDRELEDDDEDPVRSPGGTRTPARGTRGRGPTAGRWSTPARRRARPRGSRRGRGGSPCRRRSRRARRRSADPAAFVVRVPWGSAMSEITPNAAEVTASAMNSSVKCSSARSPPSARPIANERLNSSRLNAYAATRCSGGTRSAISAPEAGRWSSAKNA